jgi:DNA-binding FadR family transcriptional regulator
MLEAIERVEVKSLKAACVEELERLIISGRMPIGSAVPPERDLAERLGASRPVVHEAMVELASKGFVRVEPRKGAVVNDFYRHGTLAILETIVVHNGGEFPPDALADVLAFRLLIETETARLAAVRRGAGFLDALRDIVRRETSLDAGPAGSASLDTTAELDFEFHLLVAEASGSVVYPLLVNSFRPLYRSLIRRFYSALGKAREPASGDRLPPGSSAPVLAYHRRAIDAIAEGAAEDAAAVMREMLEHGERLLA